MAFVLEKSDPSAATPEECLERGGVVFCATSLVPLPAGDDMGFLLSQKLGRLSHKNVSYDPGTDRVGGVVSQGPAQAERLRKLFADFSHNVTEWLFTTFPRYRKGCDLDRVSFRPEEEATRRLRMTARNDLLHVDAFPNRPTGGKRILRVFFNVNPTEPRIWVTSDPFSKLLERYGDAVNQAKSLGWVQRVRESVLRLFRPGRPARSDYDVFMIRFHDFLKANEGFQEKTPKRLWSFQPGCMWLAMTDACSHAVLRGRYALEHSYFVHPSALALPDEAPAALLAGVRKKAPLKAAA